jgi:sulfoxide reductase heme-binding subunit YedZ
MTALDLSSFAGLSAMVLLTLNVLLGVLVSRNYNPARRWPHRKIPLFRIHNWTAYAALVLILLHPALLLFNTTPNFKAGDLLYPVRSPGQSLYNTLGALTFYTFLVVIVTSYFRPQLGSRPWKKIHYSAYFAAAMMFIHGTLEDPNLKNQAPDFLDGEKVLIEGCFLAVLAAAVWRFRQKRKLV